MMIEAALSATVAYLLGAIPFGLLIGRARGVDVRQLGSRNIGATNVGRVVGKGWGRLCLVLDILKGLGPVLGYGLLFVPAAPATLDLLGWLLVALAPVLGHTFPVYLGFRGGKGVSTTIGVALGLFPYFTLPMMVSLAAFAAVRVATGLVSLGSLTLAVVFPLAFVAQVLLRRDMVLQQLWPLLAVAVGLGLLIIVRHRSNIDRLLRGEELRVAGSRGGAP